MTAEALIFTLSALGISETVYLIKKRLLSEKPICPIGENCLVVLRSKYNKTFFIQNDVLGFLFYIACSLISAFLVIGVPSFEVWTFLIKIMIFAGSLMSLFFTYLQFKVIKAWCFWCLMSAFTIWSITGIILLSNDI